jgi:hypothetical protein
VTKTNISNLYNNVESRLILKKKRWADKKKKAIKGAGVVSLPIDLEASNLVLKVIPWIGGRIISIRHNTNEWLEGRFESGCYEEYSGSEWRSSGCTEEYKIIRYSIKSHL